MIIAWTDDLSCKCFGFKFLTSKCSGEISTSLQEILPSYPRLYEIKTNNVRQFQGDFDKLLHKLHKSTGSQLGCGAFSSWRHRHHGHIDDRETAFGTFLVQDGDWFLRSVTWVGWSAMTGATGSTMPLDNHKFLVAVDKVSTECCSIVCPMSRSTDP
jgi:hypothetical protein